MQITRMERAADAVVHMDVKAAFKHLLKRLEVFFDAPDLDVTVLSGIEVEVGPFAVFDLKAGMAHVPGLTAVEALGEPPCEDPEASLTLARSNARGSPITSL